jgi:hypothetical protein
VVRTQAQFGDPASTVTITPDRVGKDGKVSIWHLEEERYIRKFPIDAKEEIFYGRCEHYKPGDEPDETRFDEARTPTIAPKPAAIAAAIAGEDYVFAIHTVRELRQMCYAAKIPNPKDLKREQLIEELEKSGYVPGAERPVSPPQEE